MNLRVTAIEVLLRLGIYDPATTLPKLSLEEILGLRQGILCDIEDELVAEMERRLQAMDALDLFEFCQRADVFPETDYFVKCGHDTGMVGIRVRVKAQEQLEKHLLSRPLTTMFHFVEQATDRKVADLVVCAALEHDDVTVNQLVATYEAAGKAGKFVLIRALGRMLCKVDVLLRLFRATDDPELKAQFVGIFDDWRRLKQLPIETMVELYKAGAQYFTYQGVFQGLQTHLPALSTEVLLELYSISRFQLPLDAILAVLSGRLDDLQRLAADE